MNRDKHSGKEFMAGGTAIPRSQKKTVDLPDDYTDEEIAAMILDDNYDDTMFFETESK